MKETHLKLATQNDEKEIMDLYQAVIEKVNTSSIRLGWNIDVYPNKSFVDEAISNNEMCILRKEGRIVAAAVVNHFVNPEYDDIRWEVCGPPNKIATIHAFAVAPDKQGGGISVEMLHDIEEYCRKNGDLSIHIDALDTNIPAYKLYTRNGYKVVDCIKMFYDVVGTRDFWMLEHVL